MNLITMSNKPEEKKLEPFKWSKKSDEELKRLIEKSRASINWTEVAKWDAEGRPYEEHDGTDRLVPTNNEPINEIKYSERIIINE